jgi:hypothetical protein
MSGDHTTIVPNDDAIESLTAELADIAYRVALEARPRATWLDLELDLWKALTETVKTWERDLPQCR